MSKFFSKRKNVIIIAIVMFVALLGIFIYNTYPIIYGKLYSGDHINLDLSIYYKGKQLKADDYKIECVNPKGKMEAISKDGTKYAVKGGEYGCYSFVITIFSHVMDATYAVELKFLNSNAWYISDNNCVIEIQNTDGILNCNCDINTEYNDGRTYKYAEMKQIENAKVSFSWGN